MIQAGCPSPALPCPATPHTHNTPALLGVCRLALVAKLNQRLFGATKSPVHQHRGTAGSLHCTKQKTIRAAISKICKPQHCCYVSLPITKTHLAPSRILTSLSQRWHTVVLQSDFISEVKLQDWVRLHSKIKQKPNIAPFYFPAFKGRFNVFNLKLLQQLIPS